MNVNNEGNNGFKPHKINLMCCSMRDLTASLSSWVERLPEEKKAELRAVLIDMATGRRPFLSQS